MNSQNRAIRPLDEHTISLIAAGEIIDQPGAVVKELVENSIDAQATEITVEVAQNTVDFIRVTDNGTGIEREELPMAFARHATSKLEKINDLDALTTLGFRGEALASIAHVSKIEVISKTQEGDFAYQGWIEKGEVLKVEPMGARQGTSILVKDLFYNTPVRKKYLHSPKKVITAMLKEVEAIALSHGDIGIHFIYNGKTLLKTRGDENPINRIYDILGREIAEHILEVSFDSASYKVHGYIGDNQLFRSTPDKEYLFINGRHVHNQELAKAIRRIYQSRIPLNRYPIYLLYIEVDPILVDVNIHPRKRTVRLSNENYLIPIVQKLVDQRLTHSQVFSEVVEEEAPEKTIFDLAKERKSAPEPDLKERGGEGPVAGEPSSFEESWGGDPSTDSLFSGPVSGRGQLVREESRSFLPDEDQGGEEEVEAPSFVAHLQYIGTLFQTYLIFEDPSEGEAILMDQHAAHERILYERYVAAFKNRSIHRQVLLSPEKILLSPSAYQQAEAHMEDFASMGFHYDLFGRQTILLREVPHDIVLPDTRQFLLDGLDQLNGPKSALEQNIYGVMRMACRAAVKGGDRLSPMEAEGLMRELMETENPYTCPHGRPTLTRLKKRYFEKLFLREMS
ncbi:MAG: DNA mismatch repair endonuclease MutL [Tissierellia bacterium]|nr:DNA mismatch repair endonuclease MutL [Tissierellia bacterium]